MWSAIFPLYSISHVRAGVPNVMSSECVVQSIMRVGFHHVSVLQVKIPSMKASGGIHLTGSMARPPFL